MALVQMFLTPTPATGYVRRIPWPVEVAHLWFVQQLLIFCVVYALGRMLLAGRAGAAKPARVPATWAIVLFTLGMAFASATIRIWFDMDEWLYLLGFIKFQPFDLPRDLSLFIVGVLAYRHDWVMRFPTKRGRAWLVLAIALASAWYTFRLMAPAGVNLRDEVMGGVFTLWESFLCVSMCIGLTILFRDLGNGQNGLLKKAAQAQYATFIFHVPVVLLFQWALMTLAAGPLVKFVLVSLLSVPASFFVGYWVRKPLKL
jgi:hypothetical protein